MTVEANKRALHLDQFVEQDQGQSGTDHCQDQNIDESTGSSRVIQNDIEGADMPCVDAHPGPYEKEAERRDGQWVVISKVFLDDIDTRPIAKRSDH